MSGPYLGGPSDGLVGLVGRYLVHGADGCWVGPFMRNHYVAILVSRLIGDR